MTGPELVAAYACTTSGAEWGYRALTTRGWKGEPALPARYEHYRRTLDARSTGCRTTRPGTSGAGPPCGTTTSRGTWWERWSKNAASRAQAWGQGFSGNVWFTIHGRRGKRIERLSAFSSEQEVLFKAGTKFRVVDKRRDEAAVTHIEMEEVDDG